MALVLLLINKHPLLNSLDDYLKVLSLLVGMIGIIFALRNQYISVRSHSERSVFEMVDKLYGQCNILVNLLMNDSKLSHLFCLTPEEYERRKMEIREMVGNDKNEKIKYKYKEFWFSVQLFSIYEQLCYQQKFSKKYMRKRKKFLGDIIAYYDSSLFLNPRILGILKNYSYGKELHLEETTLIYLKEKLSNIKEEHIDLVGPFDT